MVRAPLVSSSQPRTAGGGGGWNGAAGTHFWVDPERSLVVVALSQHQPYNTQLKLALTPVVYEALPD